MEHKPRVDLQAVADLSPVESRARMALGASFQRVCGLLPRKMACGGRHGATLTLHQLLSPGFGRVF
jgi:hypothetical protein